MNWDSEDSHFSVSVDPGTQITLYHLSGREVRSRRLVHTQVIDHVDNTPNKEALIWFLLKMEFKP